MNNSATRWIVVASGNGARLLRRTNIVNRPHIDEIERFENRWQARPDGLSMSLRTPKDDHNYGPNRRVAEEHEWRYAQNLAEWIEGIVEGRDLEQVFVFASPRLHRWLEDYYQPRTIRHIHSRRGDFAWAAVDELVDHPAFLDLVA